ncbi:MAG: hypothetical protein R3F61_24290 [Myxococcota bacterium]
MRPGACALLGTVLLGMACATGYKPNLGASQLADSNRPHALIVGYLEQTSADPAVCDVTRTDGVALSYADRRVVKALFQGLEKGSIPPDRWSRCVRLLWREADPLLEADLGHALLGGLDGLRRVSAWGSRDLERASALLDVLVNRESRGGTEALDPTKLEGVALDLRAAAARFGRDSAAGVVLGDLVSAVEAEAGVLDGVPITRKTIAATNDPVQLTQWALRLPSAPLREAAQERLIARRIEKSPFAWVRENAEAVQDALAKGPLGLPPGAVVVRAQWSPARDGTALLRLLQDPLRGKVRLLPAGRDGTRSADPSLDLVDSLWLDIDGLERPITVCGPDRFDPTPCMPPSRLSMTHPVAVLAPTGRVTFPRELAMREFIELGRDGDRLSAQVVVDGHVADIDLPIRFDSVPELVLEPPNKGNGPPIKVQAWELSNERLLLEVRSPLVLGNKVWSALVESSDTAFSVQSYGHVTKYQEGRGGPITVTMHCTNCPAVRATLTRMIRSTGMAPGKVEFRRGK